MLNNNQTIISGRNIEFLSRYVMVIIVSKFNLLTISSYNFCDNLRINCPMNLNQLYRPYNYIEFNRPFKQKSDINDFGNSPKISNSIII